MRTVVPPVGVFAMSPGRRGGDRALPARAGVGGGGGVKDDLFVLAVEVGLAVLGELMEEEVDELVGSRSRPSPDRAAYRHGYAPGLVALGDRLLSSEPLVRDRGG